MASIGWMKLRVFLSPPAKKAKEDSDNESVDKVINRNNKFAILDNCVNNVDKIPAIRKELLPIPIFIPEVNNKIMLKELKSVCGLFTFKTLYNGEKKINIKNITNATMKYLNRNNIYYYTYQLKQEKAFRVIIRKIHSKMSTKYIFEEIEEQGHKVRNVRNVTQSYF